jgi:hypothetical protein
LATTTTTRSAPNGRVAERGLRPEIPAAGVVRRRQTRWIVAGVLLVVGSALVFATIWSRAGSETRVLVLTRSVDAGHVLVSSDLRSANVSTGQGVATIPATSESSVVGRTTAVPLSAGSLLNPDALGSGRALRSGEAVVGLALKPGTFPSSLAPGDHVRVVDTTGATSTSGNAAPARTSSGGATGVVMAIGADASAADGSAVVSLRLDDEDADGVAQLASAEHASLVLIPAGS